MNLFKFIIVNIVETLLRVIPFPCKTGLHIIGNPDSNSPVFLTCNYHLTVERVKMALRGMDCYLLVANSRGHNVWCGSAGGHLTHHSVISVLKTSGIEEVVDHRNVVLPQLAATGIEERAIQKKTGWKVIWGPVYAKDIPIFLNKDFTKTPIMRQVRFTLLQRVEMAVMWAFPFSVIAAAISYLFWPEMLASLTVLIWSVSLFIFLLFPLYSIWLNPKKKRTSFSKYTVVFDIGRIPLAIWMVFMVLLVIYSSMEGDGSWGYILRWGFASLVVLLIISLDLTGSTPVFKSGLHDDRLLDVVLNKGKCRGAGLCLEVCPRNCFDVDTSTHTASMP
ncbi:MAG TPA: copper oxidase, partial [Nitrospirae bacterium]|nr:copper oxidase [Nitrospirota bacterium]